jgi:hypothetical protein
MLIQKQRKIILIIVDVTCLEFLYQKSLLPLFLNCENSFVFSGPSFSFKEREYCTAKLIGLALSCTESAS